MSKQSYVYLSSFIYFFIIVSTILNSQYNFMFHLFSIYLYTITKV